MPPTDVAGLEISEILPNSRSCSPLETDPTCADYIKLYNPTLSDINLANYRLRVGYKGQSTSITNTFTWGKTLDPAADEYILPSQRYFTLSLRNDGSPLSLTDSGAYAWLEDAYGTTVYSPIVQYPDASSVTKVGQSWAYDGNAWQWTTTPQPDGPNVFTALATKVSPIIATILAPCDAGQYRNPDTNRCKSVATTSSLTPCGEDQERNPETNRCRSIATTASSALTPCQPGWERNPDTNRCRKSGDVQGASIAKVEDVSAPFAPKPVWIAAALVGCAAIAYAAYEWRQEIRLFGATLERTIRNLPSRLRRR